MLTNLTMYIYNYNNRVTSICFASGKIVDRNGRIWTISSGIGVARLEGLLCAAI